MTWQHITFSSIELNNFKCFYGNHIVNLLPDSLNNRPLILIGGDNGGGKTSIQEAINYSLYEDDDLPGINTRPTYVRAVAERLNRKALDEGADDFFVALNMFGVHNGARRDFRIERRWEVDRAARVVSSASLVLTEGGRSIDFLEDNPSAYQDFLRHMLPPRIAPFFIFDGERIQEFADENRHERRLVEAIEDILHITVYKTLRDDVKKFVVDHFDRISGNAGRKDDFYLLLAEQEAKELDLEQAGAQVADCRLELETVERQRSALEAELKRIASPYATQRDALVEQREWISKELEQTKARIEVAFEPLPILLSGELQGELQEALDQEDVLLAASAIGEQLAGRLEQLKSLVILSPVRALPWSIALSDDQKLYYAELFDEVTHELFGTESTEGEVLHDVGTTIRSRIRQRLADVAGLARELKEAIDAREKLSNDLREVERKLQSTSDDPYVLGLIGKASELSQRAGELQEAVRRLEGSIDGLHAELAGIARRLEERRSRREAADEARKASRLGQETRRTLDDFVKRLAPEKLELLRRYMEEMYYRLRKPADPVRDIDIDPDTWQVVLKDEYGRPLNREVFSAGMREMYALSLLWALSRASGRELPIVIDTPAGRLDKTNRRTLFEKYLPFAGHQVIVLSTDTEIDVAWAQRLSPITARTYRLDFDAASASARVVEGYF